MLFEEASLAASAIWNPSMPMSLTALSFGKATVTLNKVSLVSCVKNVTSHHLQLMFPTPAIIIIMYIYCVLINALSTHIIHINLNMIFYTHVEHSPIKNIKYYNGNTHTHTPQ